MLKITIPLNPASKKNGMQIIVNPKTRKPMLIPNSTYNNYLKMSGVYLQQHKNIRIDEPINVKCIFYRDTKRRVDITNLLEAISDVLVYYGVLADDNRDIIAGHDGSRVLYDKSSPRTEIEITKINNYERWKEK